MRIRNILASMAAITLVMSPIAASANTRASESAVSLAPIAADASRIGSPVGDAEEIQGKLPLWLIAFLLAAGITLAEIVSSKGIFK